MTDIARADRIPELALDWLRDGRKVALATVVQTWGSAPRPVGAQLAITADAEMAGSVSGGCVEGAVVAEAIDALEDGTPRILEFGVSDDEAFAVGLACGGTIRVLVEPIGVGQGLPVATLEALVGARGAREPMVYAVEPGGWARALLSANAPGALGELVKAALRNDKSGFVEAEDHEWFLGVHNPPLKLAVVGAVHIAQALVPMAQIAGYDVTVIDPREAFASATRFPETRLMHDWPDEALAALSLDTRTAVVTLTHDPKLDDPAIRAALASDCFYLGCLGSTRTHAKRVARLEEAGFDAATIARIHAPIGLDIGARSPAEIAVSVLAEMTAVLRAGAARKTPVAA
jgi:xanthine dehydrogenase accessory factor